MYNNFPKNIFIKPNKSNNSLSNERIKSKIKPNISFIINLSFIFLFCIILPKINANANKKRILYNLYNITIKINQKGLHKIFHQGGGDLCGSLIYYPSSMTINDVNTINDNIPNVYNFDQDINTIILAFNNEIDTCCGLFEGCSNITEIDLSEFSTQNVHRFSGMFIGCSSLVSINFQNIQTTNVEYMDWMFIGCSALKTLDISSFDPPNLLNLCGTFEGCSSLTFLDLSNLDTSKVLHMGHLFRLCTSLTSINLKNKFSTSSVIEMEYMFEGCHSLTNLEINTLDTKQVINMRGMFSDCFSLTSLNLYNFETERVNDMAYMFNDCRNLTFLNISGFRTQSVNVMDRMFRLCSSLTSLNLTNFNTQNVVWMEEMFMGCSSLKVLDLSTFDTSNTVYMAGMFNGCHSLTTLDVSKFRTRKVISMRIMFGSCHSLTSLDVSHFDTKNVYDMGWMFEDNWSLNSIDLSSFITSEVNATDYMFAGCKNLKSLDVTKFDTSNVVNMDHMFHNCPSLTYLDLHSFDTSKVTTMNTMFSHCLELTSINLESFDSSNVENMELMFYKCLKLKSLEISNFSTSNVISMTSMFGKCLSLNYLDLSNFDTSSVTSFQLMFEDCQFSSLDLSNFITSNVENMHSMFAGCNKLTSINLSSFVFNKVIDMEYMFEGCHDLKYIDLKKMKIPENALINQLIEKDIKNTIICIDDINELYKIISLHYWSYVNCSENWGEKIGQIPKSENNICLNDALLSKYNSRCYQLCSYYYYFDENKKQYLCTESLECPKSHNKLIHGKKECFKSCEETKETKYEFSNNCLKECPENFIVLEGTDNTCKAICPKENPFLYLDTLKCTSGCTILERQNNLCITNYFPKKEDNFNILDIVINQTRYELFNNFDTSVVNGKFIKERGAKIIIKRTNEKNEGDNDLDLTECEDMLKEHYNISFDESLYLFRIDIEQEGMAVPSFEYELLYTIETQNLQKLNLTICKDVKVKIDIPFNLTDDLEKYNTSSPYYNDICYITDSDEGTDITLSDRKQDYYNNNMSICEEGCDFISYNTETQKAVCSCGIKTDIPFLDNVKIDKDLLMNSFTDITNIANTKMMSCYKTVFQKKLILKNIGCFIFAVLITLNIICCFLFLIKYYKKLIQKIDKVKFHILNNIKKRNTINLRVNNRIKSNNKNNNKSGGIKSSERFIQSNQNQNIPLPKKKKSIKSLKLRDGNNKINKHSPPKSKKIIQIKEININKNENKIQSFNNNIFRNKKNKRGIVPIPNSLNNKNNIKKKSILQNKFILKLTTSEINNFTYEEAIIKDKRTFLEYYFSLLKINHLLLFIFNKEDYNSSVIKFSIFFFNIATYITVNSLFFNDSTMHKIYTDGGSYNFVYQLPQIIYSTIISAVLNGIIKILGLSEKNILNFKKENTIINNMNQQYSKLITVLKIKFTLFYFCVFSLLSLFWYYVTCFCGIYRNTQIHLIKDSLFSFSTSLVTPFGVYLLPGFFRIQALKKKSKYMYKFSKVLQIF